MLTLTLTLTLTPTPTLTPTLTLTLTLTLTPSASASTLSKAAAARGVGGGRGHVGLACQWPKRRIGHVRAFSLWCTHVKCRKAAGGGRAAPYSTCFCLCPSPFSSDTSQDGARTTRSAAGADGGAQLGSVSSCHR